MRGELTKSALEKTDVQSKYSSSEVLAHEYIESLSLDLLDENLVNSAKAMATVYIAIAAFENSVRRFVVKVLIENKGENWWEDSVSEKIRKYADNRKKDEEKIRWHLMFCNHAIFSAYVGWSLCGLQQGVLFGIHCAAG